MTMHRRLRGLTAALATSALATTGALAAAPSAHAAAPHRATNTSIAQLLAKDGTKFDTNWADFDILEAAVLAVLKAKPKSPVGLLTKGNVRLTAFAPTDRAFRKLALALTGKVPATEE